MYVSNVGLVNMLVVQNEQLCDVIYITRVWFLIGTLLLISLTCVHDNRQTYKESELSCLVVYLFVVNWIYHSCILCIMLLSVYTKQYYCLIN